MCESRQLADFIRGLREFVINIYKNVNWVVVISFIVTLEKIAV